MRHYFDVVLNLEGEPVVSASVSVFATGTQTFATIYSDNGITQVTNPLQTDPEGSFSFYVADGRYDIITQAGNVIRTLTDVEIADTVPAVSVHFQNQSVAPPTPSAGQIELYSNSNDRRLYYKDETGTVLGPLAIQGTGSLNNGTTGDLVSYASATVGADSGLIASNTPQINLAQNWTALQRFSSGVSADGTHTLTLPSSTDTLVGRATTDTLTNKTLDTAGTGNVFKVNGTQVTALTTANPTLVTTAQVPIVNVTPVTVSANVSTDQNLMSATISAGTMNSVGRTLELFCAGVYSTPTLSTTTITIKVKLGSLTLLNIVSAALGTLQASNDQFQVRAFITTQTAGASAAFETHGVLTIDLGAGNLVSVTSYADTNTGTIGTLDSTASQTLQVTIAFSSASANNTATQRQMIGTFLN